MWLFSRMALRASLGGVAVVSENAKTIFQPRIQIMQFGKLILRQRFGGKKVQRPRIRLFENFVQYRQVVAQRLAAAVGVTMTTFFPACTASAAAAWCVYGRRIPLAL